MGRFEIQGIVSSKTGEPLVQVRQLDDEDNETYGFQVGTIEAREIAQNFLEASFNAIYDAAIIAWAKEINNEEMGIMLVDVIRRFRADHWGLPDRPTDWNN